MNSVEQTLLVLDTVCITPKDLEVALATLGAEAGLLQLDLDLGTNAEALVICDEASLSLATGEPDA